MRSIDISEIIRALDRQYFKCNCVFYYCDKTENIIYIVQNNLMYIPFYAKGPNNIKIKLRYTHEWY